jgi:hypothetical protein
MIGTTSPDSIRSMSTPRVLAWIKPWMVVASLTVIAAGGATAVYFAGEMQHRRDRADIIAWEARALPAAKDAAAVPDRLRATMPLPDILAARRNLERDLSTVIASPLPGVVQEVAAAYAEAIRRTEAALDGVGMPSFAQAQRRAAAAFMAAATAEQDLVCRAHLPACARR